MFLNRNAFVCNVESHFVGSDVSIRDSDSATTATDYTEVELIYCRAEYSEAWATLWRTQMPAPTNPDVNTSDIDVTTSADD